MDKRQPLDVEMPDRVAAAEVVVEHLVDIIGVGVIV